MTSCGTASRMNSQVAQPNAVLLNTVGICGSTLERSLNATSYGLIHCYIRFLLHARHYESWAERGHWSNIDTDCPEVGISGCLQHAEAARACCLVDDVSHPSLCTSRAASFPFAGSKWVAGKYRFHPSLRADVLYALLISDLEVP